MAVGLENTDTPVAYLSLMLALNNHETGAVDLDLIDPATVRREGARLAELYRDDADWRAAEIAYRKSNESTPFEIEAEFFTRFDARGSAVDFAQLMAAFQGSATLSVAETND